MTDNTPKLRQNYELTNAKTVFVALKRPYAGKYGEKYSFSVEFDRNDTDAANLEVLGTLAKQVSKGGPVDVKDETGLVSTGRFRLGFNSDDPIPVYDGQGKLIPHDSLPNINKGTILNIKFVLVRSTYGVNKYIQAVQIVKLEEFTLSEGGPSVNFSKVSEYKFENTATETPAPDFKAVFD